MPSDTEHSAISALSKIAVALTGVQLTEKHWPMMKARLQKRLHELELDTFEDYLNYYHTHTADEAPRLIGLLTTHHTFFFREFCHFEFILSTALPALLPELQKRTDRTLRVWSAASSRGQEAYSLAMFLKLHLGRMDPSLKFEILGTDIDPESVAIAKNGVYLRRELKEVPLTLLGDHWSRGTGDISDYVKAKASIRNHCTFKALNLIDLRSSATTGLGKFDLIFCRNVFIYFNPSQIKSICTELLSHLSPGGYLFAGVSESLGQLMLPISSLGPSVYQRITDVQPVATKSAKTKPVALAPAVPASSGPIRVLCVDDSPSILTLLKQMLSEKEGFKIVGTAKDGAEAALKLSELKPDVVTLDIHMPVMTGIEYLRKHFTKGHPPVVMVTSVSRDDSELAGQALRLGASDFVEKPALADLSPRGDELRTKLRCAIEGQAQRFAVSHKLDQSFQKPIHLVNPEEKLRVIVMGLSHRAKVRSLVSELRGTQPPVVFLVEGAKANMPEVAKVLSTEIGKTVQYSDQLPARMDPGSFHLVELGSQAKLLSEGAAKGKQTSIFVFGEVSQRIAEQVLGFSGAQLVLEDTGNRKGDKILKDVASDITPATSFVYLSDEFLSRGSSQRKAA